MSNIVKTIVSKVSGNNNTGETGRSSGSEPTFSIQPHPAKSNDPADLQPPGGLRQGGLMEAFHARDPYVPTEQIRNNLPPPLSREELQAQQARLNAK